MAAGAFVFVCIQPGLWDEGGPRGPGSSSGSRRSVKQVPASSELDLTMSSCHEGFTSFMVRECGERGGARGANVNKYDIS